jgi:hypothetical protein
MSKIAKPCLACGRELYNVSDDSENQPYNGTTFYSHGQYGSTIYDPMDGHFLEINICDFCLASHPERVLEGRDRRPIKEDGVIVGFEDCDWKTVAWHPAKREVDHAIKVMRDERGETYDVEELEPEARSPAIWYPEGREPSGP